MLEDIDAAFPIANSLREPFERYWHDYVGEDIPDYRILIWGSTIQEGRTPTDLDVIIEYTGESIAPETELAIEDALHTSVRGKQFSYVDPVVAHYLETVDIIQQSRNERAYSIDEEGWVTF